MDLVHEVFPILEHKSNQDNKAELWKSSAQLKQVIQRLRCNKNLQDKEWVAETLQY
jgi:hypothetical protein